MFTLRESELQIRAQAPPLVVKLLPAHHCSGATSSAFKMDLPPRRETPLDHSVPFPWCFADSRVTNDMLCDTFNRRIFNLFGLQSLIYETRTT